MKFSSIISKITKIMLSLVLVGSVISTYGTAGEVKAEESGTQEYTLTIDSSKFNHSVLGVGILDSTGNMIDVKEVTDRSEVQIPLGCSALVMSNISEFKVTVVDKKAQVGELITGSAEIGYPITGINSNITVVVESTSQGGGTDTVINPINVQVNWDEVPVLTAGMNKDTTPDLPTEVVAITAEGIKEYVDIEWFVQVNDTFLIEEGDDLYEEIMDDFGAEEGQQLIDQFNGSINNYINNYNGWCELGFIWGFYEDYTINTTDSYAIQIKMKAKDGYTFGDDAYTNLESNITINKIYSNGTAVVLVYEYGQVQTQPEEVTGHKHGDQVFTAINNLQEFYDAIISNDETHRYYYLNEDIDITDLDKNSNIIIDSNITLCLNGKVLKINTTNEKANGISIADDQSVIIDDCKNVEHKFDVDSTGLWSLKENGTKSVYGGIVTGGTNTLFSIGEDAILTLNGGNFVGNIGGDGGAVNIGYMGSFIMNGGSIVGNTAFRTGSAVYVTYDSTFIMNGGNIKYNRVGSEMGGAVYVNPMKMPDYRIGLNTRFEVSKEAIIVDNTNNENKQNNVMLEYSGAVGASLKLDPIQNASSVVNLLYIGEDGLSGNAKVGISTNYAPTEESNVIFAEYPYEDTTDYSKYFTSDNDEYSIVFDGESQLQLSLKSETETPTPAEIKVSLNDDGLVTATAEAGIYTSAGSNASDFFTAGTEVALGDSTNFVRVFVYTEDGEELPEETILKVTAENATVTDFGWTGEGFYYFEVKDITQSTVIYINEVAEGPSLESEYIDSIGINLDWTKIDLTKVNDLGVPLVKEGAITPITTPTNGIEYLSYDYVLKINDTDRFEAIYPEEQGELEEYIDDAKKNHNSWIYLDTILEMAKYELTDDYKHYLFVQMTPYKGTSIFNPNNQDGLTNVMCKDAKVFDKFTVSHKDNTYSMVIILELGTLDEMEDAKENATKPGDGEGDEPTPEEPEGPVNPPVVVPPVYPSIPSIPSTPGGSSSSSESTKPVDTTTAVEKLETTTTNVETIIASGNVAEVNKVVEATLATDYLNVEINDNGVKYSATEAENYDVRIDNLNTVVTSLLTNDEIVQAASGELNASILLETEAVVVENIPQTTKTMIADTTPVGYQLRETVDISLYKVLGSDKTQIKETSAGIEVTMELPESIRNEKNVKIIRVHNEGTAQEEATVLTSVVNGDGTITFVTDKFSTYAFVTSNIDLSAYSNFGLEVYSNSRVISVNNTNSGFDVFGYMWIDYVTPTPNTWREIIFVNTEDASTAKAYRMSANAEYNTFLNSNMYATRDGKVDLSYACYKANVNTNSIMSYDKTTTGQMAKGTYYVFMRISDGKDSYLFPLVDRVLSDGSTMTLPANFSLSDELARTIIYTAE